MRPKTSCFFSFILFVSLQLICPLICLDVSLQHCNQWSILNLRGEKSTNYCSCCQPLGQSKSGKKCCLDQKSLFRKIEETRLTLFNFEFILSSDQGYKSSFYSTLISCVHQYKPKFTTTHISFDDPRGPPCI